MRTSGQRRVRILCEDRRTERFVRRLCERHGVRVMDVEVAPAGKGAASAWVCRSYARAVGKRRSKSFQANLGLLVVVDGDNVGVAARMEELDARLDEAGAPRRGPAEPVAVFIPTWSIETWLAHLAGREGVDESRPLKDDVRFHALWSDGAAESTTLEAAVEGWGLTLSPLPSLLAARSEAPRVGLSR